MTLDTSYHDRQLAEKLRDPENKAKFERFLREIQQVDEVIRSLDALREEAGMSKAALARAIQKNEASVRRMFTAESNPELKTVAALAEALDAEIKVVPRKHRRRTRRTVATAAS